MKLVRRAGAALAAAVLGVALLGSAELPDQDPGAMDTGWGGASISGL